MAARRPGTYRLRTYGVLIALILLAIVSRSSVPRAQLGHTVLSALGVATLGFCMLAGLLLTAGSIASERQGGTIGLLFLTDLKGYDIVLGKLAAHSINVFFGLLAIFPVLALPLLMGSVTGLEFSRLLLVFGTTLFFSLSLGLAASAMTDDPRKALGWALLLMAVAAGLLPVLWWLQNYIHDVRWLDFLLWPSPVFAFRYGFDSFYRLRSNRVKVSQTSQSDKSQATARNSRILGGSPSTWPSLPGRKDGNRMLLVPGTTSGKRHRKISRATEDNSPFPGGGEGRVRSNHLRNIRLTRLAGLEMTGPEPPV